MLRPPFLLASVLLAAACGAPPVTAPAAPVTPVAPSTPVAPTAPTAPTGGVDVAKINDQYHHVTDVASFVAKFEQDHREIYAERVAIAEAAGIAPGLVVADVGAGTGLFEPLFSTRVGPVGRVLALDIAPEFVEHIRQRALLEALPNVEARLCPEDGTGLPAASVDVVFVSDVYHHFEHPAQNLASIRATLKEGGRFVLVDFRKVEGKSSDFVLHHVRASQDEVVREVTAAGFVLDHEGGAELPLKENYLLVFRKAKVP